MRFRQAAPQTDERPLEHIYKLNAMLPKYRAPFLPAPIPNREHTTEFADGSFWRQARS